jgi:hypothetical protein
MFKALRIGYSLNIQVKYSLDAILSPLLCLDGQLTKREPRIPPDNRSADTINP